MKFVLMTKKSLITVAVLVLALTLAIVGTQISGSAAVWMGKNIRKIPIYCVDTDSGNVSISFDAAWGAEKTPQLLEICEEYDIRATFFSVGFWAEKNADQLRALSDSGRFEIATHSNNHPDMAKLPVSQIKLELTTSVNIIEGVTGKKVELFRPPYGSYSNTLLDTAQELGLYTVQWSVDSLDWKGLAASDMANRVVKKAESGSIILMHNDGENTIQALPAIIQGIKNKGLNFVPIGELIYKDNFTIDHTGKQIRGN